MADLPSFRQPGFLGGEISPKLWGRERPDVALGLRLARNFLITPQGAAESRPGTTLVAEAKLSGASVVRYVRFMVEAGTSFVLEFGNQYLRFHQNGAPVLNGGPPLELATPYAASDLARLKFAQSGDVLTIVHPSYPPYDLTRISTLNWTLYPIDFPVAPVGTNAASSGIQTATSVFCSSSAPAYSAGTTYAAGAYVVSGTVVYISLGNGNIGNAPNPSGPTAWWAPAQDSSHQPKSWILAFTLVYRDAYGRTRESVVVPFMGTGVSATIASDRPASWDCKWIQPTGAAWTPIAINLYRGRSGLLGLVATAPATPGGAGTYVTTTVQDDGSPPDYATPPPIGGFPFQAGVAGSGAWLWDPSVTYTAGALAWWRGKFWKSAAGANTANQPDLTSPTWWTSYDYSAGFNYTGGFGYANYNGISYFCIQSGIGHQPDISPTYWQPIYTYPSTVAYFEQRLVFGGSGPGVLESALALSATGQRTNFDQSSLNTNPAAPLNPSTATSSLLFYLASEERDQIRSLVSMRSLLVLTSLGEWSLRGSQGQPLTATSFDAKKHSRRGSSWISPIVSGNVVLYVAVQGSRIRDLVYNFYADSYSGKDVSEHAEHLLRSPRSIVDWAYAAVPYSVVWAVRDDGVLLSLTYRNAPLTDFEQEEKISAWAHHDTQGTVENVCVVQEGTEDAVYIGTVRQGRRFLERMATRVVPLGPDGTPDVRAFVGSDCAAVFDGRNATAGTLTQSGNTGAGQTATITAAAGATPFAAGQVGNASVVLDPNGAAYPVTGYSAVATWAAGTTYAADAVVQWQGNAYFSLQNGNVGQTPGAAPTWWAPANGPIVCPITGYTSSTVVSVTLPQKLPPALRSTPTTTWGVAVKTFTLPSTIYENQTLAVLADGTPTTVAQGATLTLTLPAPALVVVVGFGFVGQLETLDLSSPKIDVRGQHKSVARAGFEAEVTYALQAANTVADPVKASPLSAWSQPTDAIGDLAYPGAGLGGFTGFDHAIIQDRFDHPGRVAFVLTAPLPATILAITRDVTLGGG